MSAPPFMPLYVADYLADTTHLSTLEHGAYCLLLMSMWRSGGSLPDDDAKLAKFARMTAAQWARVRHTVMQFFTVENGEVIQSRLAREIDKHANVVRQRRESGSRGGRAKALKDNGPTIANANGLPCQLELEPELEERDKESLSQRAKDFESFWAAFPKKKAKPDARKAFDAAIKKTPLATMLDAIVRQRQSADWLKQSGQFIPYPATWLRQEGWADEDAVEAVKPAPGMPGDRWAFC